MADMSIPSLSPNKLHKKLTRPLALAALIAVAIVIAALMMFAQKHQRPVPMVMPAPSAINARQVLIMQTDPLPALKSGDVKDWQSVLKQNGASASQSKPQLQSYRAALQR